MSLKMSSLNPPSYEECEQPYTQSSEQAGSSSTANYTLSFTEHNPDCKITIVLLHGAFTSQEEWSLVIPHLSRYHILAIDLPRHGSTSNTSASIPHFSIRETTPLVADLILRRAHNRHAHVVGLSLGGYLALHLAAQRPEVCLSVFASGAARRVDTEGGYRMAQRVHSGVFALENTALKKLPRWWMAKAFEMKGMKVSEELREHQLAAAGRKGLSAEIVESLAADTGPSVWERVRRNRVRVCVLAAQKDDPINATRECGEGLGWISSEREQEKRRSNLVPTSGADIGADIRTDGDLSQTKAYCVAGVPHAWNLSHPELFAKGVDRWIRGKRMPSEYEELSDLEEGEGILRSTAKFVLSLATLGN